MEDQVNANSEVQEKPEDAEETPVKATKSARSRASASTAKEAKPMTKEEILDTIKSMTVLELSELVKALESEFGVSAAAPVAIAAPSAAEAGAQAPAEEEQTEFNVILKEIGPNKINVIKAVREVTTLGLKEAKDLVESAPKAVKEGVPKEEAAALKAKLEATGATAEVQ